MPSHKSLTSRSPRLTLVVFLSLSTLTAGHAQGQGSQFALRFFGTGTDQQDRVRIPIDDNTGGADASAPCDVGAGSFTIDFWLRGQLANNNSPNAGGDEEFFDFSWINGNIIVDRDIFGGSDADWGISIAGGYVRFGIGRGEPPVGSDHTIEGSTNVLDNAWHHVAVVRDMPAGQLRIYVDGALDFQSSGGVAQGNISYPNAGVTGQQTPWGPYIVLAAEKHDAGPSYPSFNGYMDELRIWTIGRTQSQIAADMSLVVPINAPSLVAYYRFEEGAGTSISDTSAASSPNGLLIAGTPGNGEWVSYAANPNNTAPVSGRSGRCEPPCDDGLFCNGIESCVDGVCVLGSDPCAPLVCDEMIDLCVECTMDEECDDGLDCTFIDVCSPEGVCINQSEDCIFDPYCAGNLGNTACNCGQCAGCCVFTPTVYGNVNCTGPVNLDDILCVLAGFANPANCREGDIAPCQRNGVINLDDILGVLQAFAGADPCNCN